MSKFDASIFDDVKLVDENDVEYTKGMNFDMTECPGGPMDKEGKSHTLIC